MMKKKYIWLIFLVLITTVSFSQELVATIRLDSVYSNASQSNGTPHPVWRFHRGNPINARCWNNFGLYDEWFVINSILVKDTITNAATNSRTINMEAWEHDADPVCIPDGQDDDFCSLPVVFTFNYSKYPPGQWHREIVSCGPFKASFSVYLSPPTVPVDDIQVFKNGSPYPETNFCRGDSVVLSVNPDFFSNIPGISEEDFYYRWEYSNSYREYCNPNSIIINDPIAHQQIADEYGIGVPCEVPDFWDPNVYDCRECNKLYMWQPFVQVQGPRIQNGINPMVLPLHSGTKNRFRVALYLKNDAPSFRNPGINSDGTPDIFIFNAPASLPFDQQPPVDSSPVTSVSDAIFSNDYFTVEHVTCNGGGGRIGIKQMGNGFFYTLIDQNSNSTWIINGAIRSAPSPSNPIIFPDHSQDPNQLIPAGDYILQVENQSDVGGGLCFSEFPITIREPAQLSFLAEPVAKGAGNPNAVSCFGQQDGSIAITPMGGVGPYDISLAGIDSFEGQSQLVTFSGLFAQTNYTLSVIDIFGCSRVGTVGGLTEPLPLKILEPQLEYFGPESEYNIKCFGEEGLVSILTEGDNFDRVISIDGQMDQTITNDSDVASFSLTDGTYQVIAAYPFGCSETVSITLKEPDDFQLLIDDMIPSTCVNGDKDSDGSISFSISGGVPKDEGYTAYLADRPDDISTGTTFSAINLRTEEYQVVIEDKYCTSQSTTFVLPPNPNRITFKNIELVDPPCYAYQTGTVYLSAESGNPFESDTYYFQMQGREMEGPVKEITYEQIGAGAYVVTISDSEGCFEDTTLVINHPDSLTATFDYIPNICPGDNKAEVEAIISGGTSPYNIQWRNPEGAIISEETVSSITTIGNLTRGDYMLSLKDVNGCANTQNDWLAISYTLLDPPYADLGEDKAICEGAPVTIQSNVIGTYSWSINQEVISTEREITVSEPGIYHLVATDLNNCITEDDVLVFINNDILATNFLMISEAYVGDTVLLIDVSHPEPTTLEWSYPDEAELLSTDPPYAEIIFSSSGTYMISLQASLGGCSNGYENQITILEGSRPSSGGRLGEAGIISAFRVSPNPTWGNFKVEVELKREHDIELSIIAGNEGKMLMFEKDHGSNHYTWNLSMSAHHSDGLYFVVIRVGKTVQMFRLIKM